ncbi:hypothetical protein AWB71_01877 [Caballeronia peredens]|nr:hypothetical protein AWB71_01877 [Caballeronia peredens]
MTQVDNRRRAVCCALTIFPFLAHYKDASAQESPAPARQYLSDTDRTACFLESIQRQSVGLGTPPWSLDNDMEALEEANKHLVVEGSPIDQDFIKHLVEDLRHQATPTRLESAETNYILKREMALIEASATKLKIDVPGPLLIGSLPTPNINAEVIAVPDSFSCPSEKANKSQFLDKIVLVNTRVLSFAHETCKIVVSCIPFVRDDKSIGFNFGDNAIDENIKNNPRLLKAYIDNILEFSMIAHTEQFVVDPMYYRFLNAFRDGMEYFLLGHEFSHIALHHVSSRGTPLSALSPSDQKVKNLNATALGFSWRQELEADFSGVALAKQVILDEADTSEDPINKLLRPVGLTAPVLFFESLTQLEDATALIKTGDEPEITKDEYQATLTVLNNMLKTDADDSAENREQTSSNVPLPDHPPLWAREFFMTHFVEDSFSDYKASEQAEQGMLEFAKAALKASRKLYDLSKPRLREISVVVRSNAGDK